MAKKKSDKLLYNLKVFLRFAIHVHKPYFFLMTGKCLAMAGQTVFAAYSLSILLYYLETKQAHSAIWAAVGISIVTILFYVINELLTYFTSIHKIRLQEKMDHVLCEKLSYVPYHYLEDPYYMELLKQARFAIREEDCIDSLITSASEMFQGIITTLSLLVVLVTFDGYIVLILGVALSLNILLIVRFFKIQFQFIQDNLDIDRKFTYYMDTLLNPENGKDFRLYPIGQLLTTKYDRFIQSLGRISHQHSIDSFHNKAGMELVKHVEMFAIYAWILYRTIRKGLAISQFSLYVTTALSFSDTIAKIMKRYRSFLNSVKLITSFVALLQLPEERHKEGLPLKNMKSITFDKVSFTYPNSPQKILDEVSFHIAAGEKISIVGVNGAGKTTLIKLLCRFYEPDSGTILINDIPIEQYDYTSYMKQISTMFQDTTLFALSIKENIIGEDTKAEETLAALLDNVGLTKVMDTLHKKEDTVYDKSFDEDGAAFSGGEGQKLAMARALYKPSSLLILDEPTSALDPQAEADFYEQFQVLAQDRIILYISHRMTSSMFSDKILLLDKGRVAAFTSHEELMAENENLYYQLFQAQAEHYV